jgi:integrase
VRLGNWLTADQGRSLLLNSQGDNLRSKRNYAILALLIGCGLRRGELLACGPQKRHQAIESDE